MGAPLNVALCWHMHQPYYREGIGGDYLLPWVYLHAIKDYSDMAAHLEQHPKMRLTVNFAPVLLEQIDDYASQLATYLQHGSAMSDPLLNLLAGVTPVPADSKGRIQLIRECQRCNAATMIAPYPTFQSLVSIGNRAIAEHETSPDLLLGYLNDQYFNDLLVWYHWSWLGYSLKQTAAAQQLQQKGRHFSTDDRRQLLEIIYDCLANLLPRYRALAERSQIELSMTPYGHPIVPLLNDFANMECAQPQAPSPEASHYPGGSDRSDWHMLQGVAIFQHHFGQTPNGVWLSEGGISPDALELLQKHNIRWTASGEGVWRHSRQHSQQESEGDEARRSLFTPNCYRDNTVQIFFRDDGLSDLIGFVYSNWDASDAVADFVQHLVNIADYLGEEAGNHVVSVILDGENAWEYYPDNGFHFLSQLYTALGQHQQLNPVTFEQASHALKPTELKEFCPGSWVYGSFSTWIGHDEKNRAWDYLVEAKHAYDRVMSEGKLSNEQRNRAVHQLAICEGSDWFWWFGDHNPADSVSDFDRLFRLQLKKLYQILGEAEPVCLDVPLSKGGGHAENAGTMRRNV